MSFESLLNFDKKYGKIIAGVDEAGRGPWAGPVVAAAVILDLEKTQGLEQVNDSKKLSEKKRGELFDVIRKSCLAMAITEVSSKVIDKTDILKATMQAMKNSVLKLEIKPEIVIIDGNKKPDIEGISAETVIDGDAKSLSIAAASIVAKVYRDRLMNNFAKFYPQYGFENHKGYGTKAHIDALKKYGVCEIHRLSYRPVREINEEWKKRGEGNPE